MWSILVLMLFFLLIVYILFMPINVFIDTVANQYYVQFTGLAKATIEGHQEELLRIKLQTFFMKFYFYPLKMGKASKKKKIAKGAIGKRNKGTIGLKKGLRVLRSFKVKYLLVDVDTGNCVLNAKLYPLFAFLNYSKGTFRINFEGRNNMALHMQNRPIFIIKSFINF
ncbi:MAG: hypothetical protein WBG90_14965 [Saonia sp.]